jgi:hypothetical protein
MKNYRIERQVLARAGGWKSKAFVHLAESGLRNRWTDLPGTGSRERSPVDISMADCTSSLEFQSGGVSGKSGVGCRRWNTSEGRRTACQPGRLAVRTACHRGTYRNLECLVGRQGIAAIDHTPCPFRMRTDRLDRKIPSCRTPMIPVLSLRPPKPDASRTIST